LLINPVAGKLDTLVGLADETTEVTFGEADALL
jgi:hypothetical protein